MIGKASTHRELVLKNDVLLGEKEIHFLFEYGVAPPSAIQTHRYELAAELQAAAQRGCLKACVPFDQPLSSLPVPISSGMRFLCLASWPGPEGKNHRHWRRASLLLKTGVGWQLC